MNEATEAQTAAAVMMVRPQAFTSNPETLASNHFQSPAAAGTHVAEAARRELDSAAAALEEAGVVVHVFPGSSRGDAPDEVFPNNWVSFHADGSVVLYPMLAPSRRRERRRDIIDALSAQKYDVRRIVDLTAHEQHGRYLEGTGSLVLDRTRRIAYACLSPRTHAEALADFGRRLDYEIVAFDARDRDGRPIYHTNVLMSLGTTLGVVCLDAVADREARRVLSSRLRAGGREVMALGLDQMHAFAGNVLELTGRRRIYALSARARDSLDVLQRARLAEHGDLVVVDVGTMETWGGGSVRCMLAEVHLPQRPGSG